jgi:hypothetical protein
VILREAAETVMANEYVSGAVDLASTVLGHLEDANNRWNIGKKGRAHASLADRLLFRARRKRD